MIRCSFVGVTSHGRTFAGRTRQERECFECHFEKMLIVVCSCVRPVIFIGN